MCEVAADAGFDVRAAYDGAAFRAAIESFDPQCILLDLSMPDEDGVELLAFLRDFGCRARVAIASSMPDVVVRSAADLARGFGLDFAGALKKPFSGADLRALFR